MGTEHNTGTVYIVYKFPTFIKMKREAHWPQRSLECTAMKAIWLLRRRFLNVFFFPENLAFRLPWPPFKISDFEKNHMVDRGLLQKQFSKTFVKISANKCKFPLFPL